MDIDAVAQISMGGNHITHQVADGIRIERGHWRSAHPVAVGAPPAPVSVAR